MEVNAIYGEQEVQESIRKAFYSNEMPSIQLQDFLGDKFKLIQKELVNSVFNEVFEIGKCSYTEHLAHNRILNEFVEWLETCFLDYIKFIDKDISKIEIKFLSFGHRNYTLMSDEKTTPGYLVQLDFTQLWEDSYGGFTSFVKNNEEVLRINPMQNSLTVVKIDEDTKYFTKYVNHKAGDKRRFIVECMLE